MNLTVEQLLDQVKHFLSTDQPNMALLYMRKALELLQKDRVPVVAKSFLDVMEDFFAPYVEYINAAVDRVAGVFADGYQATMADFALVAGA